VPEKVMNEKTEHYEYRGRKARKVSLAWEIRFETVL
jgi:hypothetical protein